MKKRIMAILMVTALVMCMFAACSSQSSGKTATDTSAATTAASAAETTKAADGTTSASSGSTDTIKIGLACPLTGTSASYGELMVDGAKIAINEINAAGGVKGQQLELVSMDDKNDPSEAALVAQRFCDRDDITAVISHGGSTCTLAACPIYEAAKMPNMSPASNNPEITQHGYEYYVRLGVRDDRCSPQVVAMLVNNLKLKKIGIIYANNDYGRGNLDAGVAAAKTLGAEVVAEQTYNPGLEKDFSTIIAKLQKAGCEGVAVYMDHEDAGLYFQQAHALGFDVPSVGQSSLTYKQLIDLAGVDALQNLYICVTFNPYSDRTTVTNFMDKFLAVRPGEVPSEPCAGCYDIVQIFAKALREGATKDNLAQWIKNTTDAKSTTFSSENVATLAENLTWDKNGDIKPLGVSLLKVDEKGNFVNYNESVDITGLNLGLN